MNPGHVYIVQMLGTNYFKIGATKQDNPLNRLRGGETWAPKGLKLIRMIESFYPYKLEKELHEDFKHKRESGEWFSLDADDLKFISEKYSVSNDKISLLIEEILPMFKNNKELLYSALKTLRDGSTLRERVEKHEEKIIELIENNFKDVDFYSGQVFELIKNQGTFEVYPKTLGKVLSRHYKAKRGRKDGCTRNLYNTNRKQ